VPDIELRPTGAMATDLLSGTAEDETALLEDSDELDAAATSAAPRRSMRTALRGTAYLIAAVLLIVAGLVVLGAQGSLIRTVLTFLGIAAAFKAFEAAGQLITGRRFDAGLFLSIAWLTIVVGAAALANVLPLGNYKNTVASLTEPGNSRPDLFSSHPLGTNNFGLDILARTIFAARVSLLTCLFAATISVIVGGGIGLIAGYYRGWLDRVISVVTDAWLAVPALVVLLACSAVVGLPTTIAGAVLKVGIPLSLVGLSTMVRVARANTLTFAQREFITASRALGASNTRILLRDLAPNVMLPLLSYAFTLLAVFIVAEGSLSYLGLGLQQPQPSWGNMIAEGTITDLKTHPHIMLVPGAIMFLTVFAFSRVGDKLRSGWDTKGVQI
jgi:peptide/nickel transport system permease protein